MDQVEKENIQSNEMETSLVERCGFCGKPKRPEKARSLSPDTCQCPNASDSTDPSIRLGAVPASAFRRSASIVPPTSTTVAETNLGLVEVVSIREKHGYFRKAIPHLPMPLAVIFCLMNVLIPGSGTLLSVLGIICGCKTEHDSKRKSSLISLLAAFLQLITAPIIVGWIWSVLWGITFVNVSSELSKEIDITHPSSML